MKWKWLFFTFLFFGCLEHKDVSLQQNDTESIPDIEQTKDQPQLAPEPNDGTSGRKKFALVSEPIEPRRHQKAIQKYLAEKTVCDPFDDTPPTTSSQNGLKATLHYRGEGQPAWKKLAPFFEEGVKSQQELFFSDLYTPTRKFDQGFGSLTGEAVKDDNGERLIEWFGLQFDSHFQLTEEQDEGWYQVALLSDDGSLLEFGEDTTPLIDNDRVTPTRMACGKTNIYLKPGEKHRFHVKYFQGPRLHISLVALIRPVGTQNTATDPSCGTKGNRRFFDDRNNSAPQKGYTDLLDRGWQPMTNQNFVIMGDEDFNPCAEGENPPEILGFFLAEAEQTSAFFFWNTNIESASYVKIKNLDTGEVSETESDRLLQTRHYIEVPNLVSGTRYEATAVSVSEQMGVTESTPLQFTFEPF